MEVRLQIDYAQLLAVVRQLPANQLLQLKQELSVTYLAEKSQHDKIKLRNLLLQGPVMSPEEYQLFLENRLWMNQWRKAKLFA
jgi:hypothetical protein